MLQGAHHVCIEHFFVTAIIQKLLFTRMRWARGRGAEGRVRWWISMRLDGVGRCNSLPERWIFRLPGWKYVWACGWIKWVKDRDIRRVPQWDLAAPGDRKCQEVMKELVNCVLAWRREWKSGFIQREGRKAGGNKNSLSLGRKRVEGSKSKSTKRCGTRIIRTTYYSWY